MMGFPCLRVDGKFFASTDRATGDLLVKLPEARVDELVDTGRAESFAPAGRRFREWAAIPCAQVAHLEAPPRRSPRLRRRSSAPPTTARRNGATHGDGSGASSRHRRSLRGAAVELVEGHGPAGRARGAGRDADVGHDHPGPAIRRRRARRAPR